jgi:hypothetical protein
MSTYCYCTDDDATAGKKEMIVGYGPEGISFKPSGYKRFASPYLLEAIQHTTQIDQYIIPYYCEHGNIAGVFLVPEQSDNQGV